MDVWKEKQAVELPEAEISVCIMQFCSVTADTSRSSSKLSPVFTILNDCYTKIDTYLGFEVTVWFIFGTVLLILLLVLFVSAGFHYEDIRTKICIFGRFTDSRGFL